MIVERERERESKIVVFMVTGLNKQVKSNCNLEYHYDVQVGGLNFM